MSFNQRKISALVRGGTLLAALIIVSGCSDKNKANAVDAIEKNSTDTSAAANASATANSGAGDDDGWRPWERGDPRSMAKRHHHQEMDRSDMRPEHRPDDNVQNSN